MSDIVHHTTAPDIPLVPKRFTCGRKVKGDCTFTRVPSLVDCPQCLAKLRESAAEQSKEG